MAKYWVDPPSGWRYGFPRVWDDEQDGTLDEFLRNSGYPDSTNDWVRMWEWKEIDDDSS